MRFHPSHRQLAASLLALLLSSCAVGNFGRGQRQVPFNESEFAGYGGPGTGSVVGQLVATYEGEPHFGGSSPISLVPVTSYTTEMVIRELGDGVALSPSDARYKKYVRLTRADALGNFSFHQIPAGDYYIAGVVTWSTLGTSPEVLRQWACEHIIVEKGQTVRIKITHNPQHPERPIPKIATLE